MDAPIDPRRAARLAREGRIAASRAQDSAMDQVKQTIRATVQRLVSGRRLPPGGPWQTALTVRRALADTPGILVREARRLDDDGDRAQVIVASLRTEEIDLGRGNEPWLSLSCDRLLIDRRRATHFNLHGHLLVHAHAQKRYAQRQGDADYRAFCDAMLVSLPACALIATAWPVEGEIMVPVPGGAFLGQRIRRPIGSSDHEIRAYHVQGLASREIPVPPTCLDNPNGRIRLELRTFIPNETLGPSQDAVVTALSRVAAASDTRADAIVALAWTMLLGDTTGNPDPDEIAAATAEVTKIAASPAWAECAERRARAFTGQARHNTPP